MTKPKPPFAEAVEAAFGHAIRCGDTVVEFAWSSERAAREACDRINAAVAAREARLVGVIRAFLALPADWLRVASNDRYAEVVAALDGLRAALEGTGPDLVAELRAQVEALKANGPWMVLHDLAATGGLASERAAEVMRALGMKA